MTANSNLTVELGDRSYPIIIGDGLLENGVDFAAYLSAGNALVVTDSNVDEHYGAMLQRVLGEHCLGKVVLPAGEAHKNLGALESIIDALTAHGAGRDTTVVALGGGVVGDIAGFAAASYMRGVGFLQVPTTLLAQVDSSVGGKTGVNHQRGKNLIGAFHQPRAVVIDTRTLNTLPDRELKAGLAEVIKYGAIVDADFFAWLEENIGLLLARDADALAFAIRRSCACKAEVVAHDEREAGRRAILNFGHTFGHAIEHAQGYGEWLHGEAVAAGMLMAAAMSDIDQSSVERLTALVAAAGLPKEPPPVGADTLRKAMQLDKKVQAGALRLVLLRELGEAFVSSDFDHDRLGRVLARADK